MRKIIFISLMFMAPFAHAGFTVKGTLVIGGVEYTWPTNPGTAGQCLQTDGNTPATLTWATCGSAVVTDLYVLLEDATTLLLEDGTKMVLQ